MKEKKLFLYWLVEFCHHNSLFRCIKSILSLDCMNILPTLFIYLDKNNNLAEAKKIKLVQLLKVTINIFIASRVRVFGKRVRQYCYWSILERDKACFTKVWKREIYFTIVCNIIINDIGNPPKANGQ